MDNSPFVVLTYNEFKKRLPDFTRALKAAGQLKTSDPIAFGPTKGGGPSNPFKQVLD